MKHVLDSFVAHRTLREIQSPLGPRKQWLLREGTVICNAHGHWYCVADLTDLDGASNAEGEAEYSEEGEMV